MKPIFLAALALCLLLPTTVHATDALTLDQALQKALAANPDLDAAGYATEAALARPSQAATPPDPQFMVQFSQVPINTIDVGQGMITYMVQQEIPFPAKLVYGYKAERRAAEAMKEAEAMTAQELERQVTQAYLDLWQLQEEKAIQEKTLAIYRQSKGSAESAYAALEGPVTDHACPPTLH